MGNASSYPDNRYNYNTSTFDRRGVSGSATQSPVRLKQTLRGHTDTVTSISYSRDGQYLVTSSSDGTAKLWNEKTGEVIQTYRGHTWTVWCVKLSNHHDTLTNSDSFIVTTSSDCHVKVWNTITGVVIHTIQEHQEPIYCVDISSDNLYIATGSADETCKLFSTTTNNQYNVSKTFTGHKGPIFCVAFTTDVQYVVTGSEDKTVKLWSIVSGDLVRTFTGHKCSVLSVSVSSSNNNLIATTSSDQKAILWNTSTGREVQRYLGHTGTVSCVTMPYVDDSIVITGSYEKSIKIWNRRTGKQLYTLEGHHCYVTSVKFNPTNKAILATGSDDKLVKIWDLSNLEMIRDMTWNIVRHFIMLRWLVSNKRALPKSLVTDHSSSSSSSKAPIEQQVLYGLTTIEIDDVFKHILSFLVPPPSPSSRTPPLAPLEGVIMSDSDTSTPPPLRDESLYY